ncbi:ATP-binding cassette domain-containing protein [Bacillus tianshenii]|uniref:ABC transporter ATP-binding protein n=1 Tax=Sutcliffiella tianshenii TaxID=1463404 RepID=UPI001CD1E6D9|nr:oligopeptide/dipeptide ABC transporter ATP-binding protein [Bacillus tianshenii]MCA1321008.1 ATP-binding cassette domain-containing protein [Bacillus tianshenii]
MTTKEVLIEVKDLEKHFKVGKGRVLRAIDGLTFSIYKGETLGLVGESGCGKSTVGRTMVQLYSPTRGQILFENENLHTKMSKLNVKRYRKKMQMIFQDPYSSLNPRLTVEEIIAEGLLIHQPEMTKEQRRKQVTDLLEQVGLNRKHADRYPHEFSGGQRQRIGIARALSVNPDFIVADEPIAALDVSIQAQIVNLLKQLQEEKGLTYLFIAHDLSMVKHISDRIAVMYLGKMVELADSESLYEKPLHPYTEALLSAIPLPDPNLERQRKRIILKGDVPSPTDIPTGCRFYSRCPKAMDVCSKEEPSWIEVEEKHYVACHLYE